MKIAFLVVLLVLPLGARPAEEPKTPAQLRVDRIQAACEKEAPGNVSVTDPGEVMKAIADATQKCVAKKDREDQVRQIALHKGVLALCSDTADHQKELEGLSDAGRDAAYIKCVKANGKVP